MALTLQIRQHVSQRIALTPQLRQAIELLQLNNMELREFIEHEFEQNPLLELEDTVDLVSSNMPNSHSITHSGNVIHNRTGSDRGNVFESDSRPESFTDTAPGRNTADSSDIPNQQTFSDEPLSYHKPTSQSGGLMPEKRPLDFDNLIQTTSRSLTLRDHLREQLIFDSIDQTTYMIGLYMIDLLDEAGYLVEDLDNVAAQLGCQRGRLQLLLDRLQTFDPPGVFARTLAECLQIQLRKTAQINPATEALLRNLDLLAEHNFPALAQLTGLPAREIRAAAKKIKALNPKPGLTFHHEITVPLVPDVYTWRQPDGTWIAELNNDTLPKVLVNSRYYTDAVNVARLQSEKLYLVEQLRNANWLVRSLDQRAKTIHTVTQELIRQQKGFLTKGIEFLTPLTLRNIANNTSMHESTVSRAISNKYIATPRGIFSFKYFFTSAINSNISGKFHSAEAVRHRIKCMITNELPGTVMSDDHIANALKQDGISIARRTVAKYRDAMHIPSSIQRRRLKGTKG